MKAARKTAKVKTVAEGSRLGRDDWLDAAYAAVAEGGFDKVRVLTLADQLGVTRGSFYWHFADHAELLSAMLQRWLRREIDADLALQAESTNDAKADLMHLLDVALARGGADVKAMRFELALRGLGRRDPEVAKMLVEVDESRMSLFESKFLRLTGNQKSATDLAVVFYLAITGGIQALARPASTARVADYIRSLIADYLIERHLPARPDR